MQRLLQTSRRPLIGVVHLPPLPGSPRPGPGMERILERALKDAEALMEGGAQGLIVENLGDAPFAAGWVEPHVVGALSIVSKAIVDCAPSDFSVGVNVLRNDAKAALAVASVSGADFVRVNVHTGVMATDQGLIEGRARETLLYRNQLGSTVGIAADLLVKHATPLGNPDSIQLAQDTYHRGGADVLITTGSGTGQPVDPVGLKRLREACQGIPFWIGCGLNLENVSGLAPLCDGAIVGSALHEDGDLEAALCLERIQAMVAAWGAA